MYKCACCNEYFSEPYQYPYPYAAMKGCPYCGYLVYTEVDEADEYDDRFREKEAE